MKRTMKNGCLLLLLAICLSLFAACGEKPVTPDGEERIALTNDQLYERAVFDAVVAEESEICPLVNLTAESDLATVRDGKVLLITFHHYPTSYIPGTVNSDIGYYMWTFTDKEIKEWYQNHHEGVDDWRLRFCQLLGMSETSTNTYFSAVWADLDDVIRPAYQTDPTKPMTTSLGQDVGEDYTDWFNGQYVYSFSSERLDWRNPWTRLGYSYDWADNGVEYGLSEFLILKGADVEVEFTYTVEEFLAYLAQ